MKDQELVEGLRNYLEDIIDALGTAESLILRLNSDKTKDTQRKILQMLHSIKGTAGSYGLREFETCIHKMEDCVSILAAGGLTTEEAISDLLEQLDYIHHRAEKAKLHPERIIADMDKPIEPVQVIFNDPAVATVEPIAEFNQCKKVLILEDSKVVSKILLQTLNPYNLSCSLISDGYTALGRLLLEHFDVIITQIHLKLIDGVNLAGILQKLENPNRATPFIFISGSGNYDTTELTRTNRFVIKKGPDLTNLLLKQMESLIKLEKKQDVPAFVSSFNSIAVIDDSEDIHNIIKISFADGKTRIINILDPLTELNQLNGINFDVILLDYQLGEVSGIDVLKKIRGMGISTPVIFLTATEDAKEISNLLKQDISGLIRKPFIPRKLPFQIIETLSLHQKRVG
jgi:CheY-like chemotaxis protein